MPQGCCFPAGSLVGMFDGSFKVIEHVVPGDRVKTYNPDTQQQELGVVGSLKTPLRDAMASILLSNGKVLEVTPDHPLYCQDGLWKALDPRASLTYYRVEAQQLTVGDILLTLEGEWLMILGYSIQVGEVQTYSLGDVTPNPNFYAGQDTLVLAHNRGEDPPVPFMSWPAYDIEGQRWEWSDGSAQHTVTATAWFPWPSASDYWVQQTWWASPVGDPNQALPDSSKFPAGMIINCQGQWWQVSTNGRAWVGLYTNEYTSPYFSITGITNPSAIYPPSGGNLGKAEIQLSGSPWPTTGAVGNWEAQFTATAQDQAGLNYWTVTVPVAQAATGVYNICLNSVNGLMAGDKIEKVGAGSTGSWTVSAVDPHLSMVLTLEEVNDLQIGNHIFWTQGSQDELILQDPRILLPKAAYPFNVDLTEFSAPQTLDSLYGLLSSSASWFSVGDIEPTLTRIKVCEGGHWATAGSKAEGSPDTGWFPGMGALNIPIENPIYPIGEEPPPYVPPTVGQERYTPMADWTSQLLSPPASLMPDATWAINPWTKLRNRTNCDPYRRKGNGIIWVDGIARVGSYVRDLGGGVLQYVEDGQIHTTTSLLCNSWSPAGANMAGPFVVYDYTYMERVICKGKTIEVDAWNGTGFNMFRNSTYPEGRYIQSAVPVTQGQMMIPHGLLIYSVVVTGSDNEAAWPWVAADTSGDRIDLYFKGTQSVAPAIIRSVAVPPALVGGMLRETPFGLYLVGNSAIGEITWTGTTLGITVQYLVDAVSWLWVNTLVAPNDKEILIFGRKDSGVGQNAKYETWMFRLDRHLTPTLDQSIIWSEKIQDGFPNTMGCIKDPTKPSRIVGHIGGQLFQVDNVRPWCVERFTPGGMTGMDLVEHICQMYNSLAIPDANGTLHIVSRNVNDPVLNLTVDRVKVNRTLSWADFSSLVRITSQDGNYYYDAYGQQGGGTLEVNSHPLIWSLSSCAGMAQSILGWFGTPRPVQEEEWFWSDADTAAPWESIRLFSKVSVNGGPPMRIMSLSQNYVKGTASVILIGA